MSIIENLKKFSTENHIGIKIPGRKNTREFRTVQMPCPPYVILPMKQHIGSDCEPIVKVNDKVKIGQLIAKETSNICAPIHASISGRVSKIEKFLMPNGIFTTAITIESDGMMDFYEQLAPPEVSSREELIEAAKNCGLVGLGGAGFPTHVKLNFNKDTPVDTFIVNAAECEPYITSDNRMILEKTEDVVRGVDLIKRLLNINRAIISIADNKPKAIEQLKYTISKLDVDIELFQMQTRYPNGAEKILIKICTGRVIPFGKRVAEFGCMVMNVSTVATLYNYIKTGIPLVSRIITVDGSAVNTPKNVCAPIGTPIRELINFCGGYKNLAKKILMGGPMMGLPVPDDSMPILKQNNAILAFDKKDATKQELSPCIRCGKCVESCPMNLLPYALEQNVESKNLLELSHLNINACMECGCCDYSCPAHRPLVQAIRQGKAFIKKQNK